jgi:hypothetical protein
MVKPTDFVAATSRVHVPVEIDRPFRFNPITDFGLARSPISVLSDRCYHFSEMSDRNAETTFFF